MTVTNNTTTTTTNNDNNNDDDNDNDTNDNGIPSRKVSLESPAWTRGDSGQPFGPRPQAGPVRFRLLLICKVIHTLAI